MLVPGNMLTLTQEIDRNRILEPLLLSKAKKLFFEEKSDEDTVNMTNMIICHKKYR